MKFLFAALKASVLSFTFLCSLSAASAAGHDKWTLQASESAISFVSIKKTFIGEAHTFTDISGSINHGKASITIKPDSVSTNIPIRNERARKFLFETGIYPTIVVNSDVSSAMKSLEKGATNMLSLPAILTMHGVEKSITLDLAITRNGKQAVTVATTKPVVINAAEYNMVGGIKKLGELAGVDIVTAVPVSFVLTFKKS